jgi:sulfonate transport system permease protein
VLAGMKTTRGAGRFVGWLLPATTLGMVEVLSRAGVFPVHAVPAPSQVAATLLALAHDGLWQHVAASGGRVLTGFALGAGVGVILGTVIGLNRTAARLIEPTLQALRAIPSLAWVPLLLLWLGIDEAPKIILIALGGFFPVYFNLCAGIRDADRKLIELAHASGLSGFDTVRRVLLPASLPSLFTGLRAGLGLAWMFLVAAELIAATRGIGYLLTDGRETGRADVVLGAIVLLGALGALSDQLLQFIEHRALHWRDSFGNAARQAERTGDHA